MTNTWIMLIERNLQMKHILIHKNYISKKYTLINFLYTFADKGENDNNKQFDLAASSGNYFSPFSCCRSLVTIHCLRFLSILFAPSHSPTWLPSSVFYWTCTLSNHHDFLLDRSLSLVQPTALKCSS